MSSPIRGLKEIAGDPGKVRKRRRRFYFQLVASIILLAIVYWVVDIEALWRAIRKLPLVLWLGAVASVILLHVLQSAKWRIFLGISGVRVSLHAAIRAHGAGQFGGVILPSVVGGDAVRTALLAREFGKPEAIVFAGVVDRVVDTAALLALVAIGFILAPSALPEDTVVIHSWVFVASAIASVVGVLTLVWLYRPTVLRRLPRKMAQSLLKGRRAFRTMRRHPRHAALAILIGLAIQAGFVVTVMMIGESLGLGLDTRLWFLLWPLAKMASMLPASVGGLGLLELAFGFLVTGLADRDIAIATSVVNQTLRFAVAFAGGAYWMFSDFESAAEVPSPSEPPG